MTEREEFKQEMRLMDQQTRGVALCDTAEVVLEKLSGSDLARVSDPNTGVVVVAARGSHGVIIDKVFNDLFTAFGTSSPKERPSTSDIEFKQYADLMEIVDRMRLEDVQRVLCGVALLFTNKAPKQDAAMDGGVAMVRGDKAPLAVMVGVGHGSLFVRGVMGTLKARE